MKRRNYLICCLRLAAVFVVSGSSSTFAQTFTPGDLVVSVYGSLTDNICLDGNLTPITLAEFGPNIVADQSPVLTVTLPTADRGSNVGVVGEYGSSSESNIQLSGDGRFLALGAYDALEAANGIGSASNTANGTKVTAGTAYSNNAGIPLAQSASTDVSRVAVFIDAYGNVNSSTTFNNLYPTNNPRCVYSQSGSSLYISGEGSSTGDQGLYYAQDATQNLATPILTAYETRFVTAYGGNLYCSVDQKNKATGIFEFSGIPTSATSPTQITASTKGSVNYSPDGFFFANATTLYVADTGVPKNGGTGDGGIQKWTYDGSSWILQYTFTNPAGFVAARSASSAADGETGFEAVTGKVVNGTAYLYAVSYTAGDAEPNGIYGITDTLAATTAGGQTFTEIASAPGIQVSGKVPKSALLGTSPDYVFKGVSFAPQPITVSLTNWEQSYALTTSPSATPENDGVPNLLKYLYDINPSAPMTSTDRAALPAIQIDTTSKAGTTYLTLSFRENASAAGITINLQSSLDLQTWTTITPDISQEIGNDPSTGDPVVEIGIDLNGEAKEFLRLNVSSP
jgi:hypothetical protein